MKAKNIGAIYETTNYELFHRLEGNRDVINSRKSKIKTSIEEVGYVLNPIIVNSDMEIIDGQGRFEALKELGMPIYYIVDQNAGVRECLAMNMNQTNWRTTDYALMYAETGNQNYARFMALSKRYPDIPMDTLIGAAQNVIITGSTAKFIRTGKLKFDKAMYDRACDSLDFYQNIRKVVDEIPGNYRSRSTAVMWMFNVKGVDKKRLEHVFRANYPVIAPVVDTKVVLFLAQVSDLYNARLSRANRIYFDTEYKMSKGGIGR